MNSPRARTLRHVILFAFKPGTTAEQIAAVQQAFAGLQASVKLSRHGVAAPLTPGVTQSRLIC